MTRALDVEERSARAAERLALVRARVAELDHQRTVRASRKRLFAVAGAALACAPLLLLLPRSHRPEPPYVEIVSSGKVEIEYQGRAPAIRVHRGLVERRTVPHAEVDRGGK